MSPDTAHSGTASGIRSGTVHDAATTFVREHPDAALITLRADGTAHTARVEVGVLDGRICTAGAPGLVRTRNLRRDPRCSLFVFGPHPRWLGVEAHAVLHDGPEAPEMLMAYLRSRHADTPPGTVIAHDEERGHDRPYTEREFLDDTRTRGRFVVTFDVDRAYGNPGR